MMSGLSVTSAGRSGASSEGWSFDKSNSCLAASRDGNCFCFFENFYSKPCIAKKAKAIPILFSSKRIKPIIEYPRLHR